MIRRALTAIWHFLARPGFHDGGIVPPPAEPELFDSRYPLPEIIDPVRCAEGFRLLWKVGDAVVMWLSHPTRITGRWTCEEIAEGINADPVYAFEKWSPGKLKATAVNAAMSGISTRAARPERRFCTDMPPEASVHWHPTDGLGTPWQKRLWQLTPRGIQHAKLMSDVKNRYTDNAEKRRAERTET